MSHSAMDRQSDHDEKLNALQSTINELEIELQSKNAEVTSLQEKLDAAPAAASPVSDEQVEAIRRDAMAFQAQRQAEMENEMKKMRNRPSKDEFVKVKEKAAESQCLAEGLQQDVDKLSKQVEEAKRAALTAESEKRELQKRLVAGVGEEDLAKIRKQQAEAQSLANRRLQEIEKLEQAVETGKRQTETAQCLANSRQLKIDGLSQQVTNEQRMYEQKVASLPSAEEQASLRGQLSAAHELVQEKQKTFNAINTQLEQEKEKCRRLESINKEYKASCDSAVADEKERCEKKVTALQNQVAQDRSDLENRVAEENKFRADIDKRWQMEQGKSKVLEKERNEYRDKCENLLQQIEERKQTAAAQPEPDARRVVVQELQQDEPVANPPDRRGPRPAYAQDTQEAYEYLQDPRFTNNLSDKNTMYQKVQQASNSSSKRAPSSSSLSSSPGFVNSQVRKSTTYGENGSGHKQRPSRVKEPVKRKSSTNGRVVDGYEAERKKRVKPNELSQAEYRPPHPRAPPSIPSSSYGSRTRVTRSGTAQVNARFAQELSKGQGGGSGGR